MRNPAEVSFSFDASLDRPATVVLQVAPPRAGMAETLTAAGERGALTTRRVVDADGNSLDLVEADAGPLSVRYRASVAFDGRSRPVSEVDRIVSARPSRYCPSDLLIDLGEELVQGEPSPVERVRAICDHVNKTISYSAGLSQPEMDAIDTIETGAGVCRDFAHVVVALCRSVDVPARVAAVYAPGLSPMDFHLVAETALDGVWYVWDATRLASRHNLIRIATGRDAADVAFCTNLTGTLNLNRLTVAAVSGHDIVPDDHLSLITLA